MHKIFTFSRQLSFMVLFTVLFSTQIFYATTTLKSEYVNESTQKILITIEQTKKESILPSSIDLTIDTPNISLSAPEITILKKNPQQLIISVLTTTKPSFNFDKQANIYLSYYLNASKKTVQEVLPFTSESIDATTSGAAISQETDSFEEIIPTIKSSDVVEKKLSWSARLSDLISSTHSLWIRLLLVLFLGLLMSLTPCIYPMIPITIGILQSNGKKSIWYNFLQALMYTCGIATTFAFLGLLAAFTGQLFGSIMSNPFVISILTALLIYLGLSMFGFYEMYTPSFMRGASKANNTQNSLISIFLFGLISGTVASPCLSPGLILLLSIVTTIGSKLLGFALLFSFGLGLGIPLLIIGTFSGSINSLPRAGMWMVEVKKIFGFMLFGMAFYFLKNIMPWSVLLGLATIFTFAAGVIYFYSIKSYDSPKTKTFKNIVGTLCLISSVFLATKTYQAFFFDSTKVADSFWNTNIQNAQQVSDQEKKHLFVYVTGQACSICKAIDKKILQNTQVKAALNKFVNVKIDDSHDTFSGFQKKYNILGVPTFLLIEQGTGNLLSRWGSELYSATPEEFIQMIKNY